MPFPTSVFAQNGRFSHIEPIGRGAAGQVYRAIDNLGRQVAIKEALPSVEGFAGIRAKFEKESRLQATLNHPNIIRVYHLEEDPQTRELYLICEYADAGSLADYLEHNGPLSEEQTLTIGLDICAALEETQRRQIVHRDIKPSNILLNIDEHGKLSAKLGDFGIAQDSRLRKTTILPGTTHPGTPLYMPPEQTDVMTVLDTRADLFALGVTLWEVLTGQDYKLLLHHDKTPALNQYARQTQPGTSVILRRAMESNPAERYQRASDLRTDIQRVLEGQAPLATVSRSQPRFERVGFGVRSILSIGIPVGMILIGFSLLFFNFFPSTGQSVVLVLVLLLLGAIWIAYGQLRANRQGLAALTLFGGSLLVAFSLIEITTKTPDAQPLSISSEAFATVEMIEAPATPWAAWVSPSYQVRQQVLVNPPAIATILPGMAVATNLPVVGGNPSQCVRGVGDPVSETRQLDNLQALNVLIESNVIVRQGNTDSLKITAPEGIFPMLIAELQSGTLTLSSNTCVLNNITYELTVRDLGSVMINGAAFVDLQGLNVDALTISLLGSGRVVAAGAADQLRVSINGDGEFRGRDLVAQNAVVEMNGSGELFTQAQQSLNAAISGDGKITYFGDPQLTTQINGLGTVVRGGTIVP
jgi:hypothetical protein